MNLRDYLDSRERELVNSIKECHDKLAPLERELAEIRRAKGAIGGGMRNQHVVGALTISGMLAPHDQDRKREPERVGGIGMRSLVSGFGHTDSLIDESPLAQYQAYQKLTMKELVVKVLSEHFHQGATTREMLDFFRDAWGRQIERTNLSPQISRLYQEGIIGRETGLKRWYLVPEERRGKHAYRVIRTCTDGVQRSYKVGEIVFLLPQEADPQYFELTGKPVTDPDPDDDLE